jgi:hypothetical protein
LNDTLERRLFAYAVGAGAVAAGILPLSQPAAAEIVVVPTKVTLGSGSSYVIDIGGAAQFTLLDRLYVITGSFSTALFSVTCAASASVVGRVKKASALQPGTPIGPAKPFQNGKALLAGAFRETQISQSSVFGQFANTFQRYLGLKFVVKGQTHYGWARFSAVKATANSPMVKALLTGYAYETTANKPIMAGQTADAASLLRPESGATIAPQPASLGMLAVGYSGLNAWRKEAN